MFRPMDQCWSPRGQVLVLEDNFEVLGLGLESCVLDSINAMDSRVKQRYGILSPN